MSTRPQVETGRFNRGASTPPPAIQEEGDFAPLEKSRRLKKLREYGDRVLAMADPLLSLLGCVEVDLHQQLCELRGDMDELRRTMRDPVQRFAFLMPMSEQYYKLAKQLEAMIKLRNDCRKEARKVLRPPTKPGSANDKSAPVGTSVPSNPPVQKPK